MLEEAEKYPLEYDEDSPKLTAEQLDQFRPVHYATMEERTQCMKAVCITEPAEASVLEPQETPVFVP
jgi:hypothetical protein